MMAGGPVPAVAVGVDARAGAGADWPNCPNPLAGCPNPEGAAGWLGAPKGLGAGAVDG